MPRPETAIPAISFCKAARITTSSSKNKLTYEVSVRALGQRLKVEGMSPACPFFLAVASATTPQLDLDIRKYRLASRALTKREIHVSVGYPSVVVTDSSYQTTP